jgi:hypothetical protein
LLKCCNCVVLCASEGAQAKPCENTASEQQRSNAQQCKAKKDIALLRRRCLLVRYALRATRTTDSNPVVRI